jgi:hypothetical protein
MRNEDIQNAINNAEEERDALGMNPPGKREIDKIVTVLPKAAEIYRRQLAKGLSKDPGAVLKAREVLRAIIGEVTMVPVAAKGKVPAISKPVTSSGGRLCWRQSM